MVGYKIMGGGLEKELEVSKITVFLLKTFKY
jgi:hypothetical protein